MNELKVHVASTGKDGIIQPEACKDNILPKLHCSYLVIGKSGSGKSIAYVHLIKSKSLLGGVFNEKYYFIGSLDDTFTKNIKIPDKNVIKDFDLSKLQNIIDKQKDIIKKKGIAAASKTNSILIVFDDILSQPRFLKSDLVLKLVTECRHYLITCIFNTQSYTKIPRTIRINCRGLMLFPSNRNEMEKFSDEQCPPRMSKKQFIKLLDYATKEQYNFCFMNMDSPTEDMIRKNFDTIIN
jgi:hypothetical protein